MTVERTLHHFPLDPASRQVRLALGEKRLPFSEVQERYWERRAALEALNPSGLTPVLVETTGGTRVAELRDRMQRTMQSHAAVFRSSASLIEGVAKMQQIWGGQSDIGLSDRSMVWNSDLTDALELDNLLANAMVTMASAENRKESRGAHAHDDFPERDDAEWMKHTISLVAENGVVALSDAPVRNFTMTNDVQPFPPKKRVY